MRISLLLVGVIFATLSHWGCASAERPSIVTVSSKQRHGSATYVGNREFFTVRHLVPETGSLALFQPDLPGQIAKPTMTDHSELVRVTVPAVSDQMKPVRVDLDYTPSQGERVIISAMTFDASGAHVRHQCGWVLSATQPRDLPTKYQGRRGFVVVTRESAETGMSGGSVSLKSDPESVIGIIAGGTERRPDGTTLLWVIQE